MDALLSISLTVFTIVLIPIAGFGVRLLYKIELNFRDLSFELKWQKSTLERHEEELVKVGTRLDDHGERIATLEGRGRGR